jgi:hypothetical protein
MTRWTEQEIPKQDGVRKSSSLGLANLGGYATHYSRSHDAVIRVYDAAGNVMATREHKGNFKEP